MNNNAGTFRIIGFTEMSERGWRDHLAGLGYPPDYDAWPGKAQRNYERGRLRRANVALAFPGTKADRQPWLLIRRAEHAVGSYFPAEH